MEKLFGKQKTKLNGWMNNKTPPGATNTGRGLSKDTKILQASIYIIYYFFVFVN